MCFDGLLIDFDDIKSNEINLYVLNNINTVDDLENGLIASRRNDCNKKLKYFTKEKYGVLAIANSTIILHIINRINRSISILHVRNQQAILHPI